MIKQDSITNYVKPTPENAPINAIANEVSRMLSITTASFIAFLRESFASVMNGVPMVLADEETSINPIKLAELIKKYEIDGMSATPSRLQQYLTIDDFRSVIKDIKVITIGGEKFIESLYPTLVKYTDADIYNSYGPTEVTIASHAKLMKDNIVSEGKPIHNTIDSIVDIDNNPLPKNIVGNIALGGVGVSAGYWNKPDLTKEVFYTRNNIPYYNTGDLGYKRDDGELVVVGRADSQIKLRGLRIETGEIENVILKNSDIEVVFVNVQTINDTEYLCAYYVADSQIDTDKLKEDISQELTDYMIPTFFIQLDELPLNPNGKLDRKKLPLPSVDDEITEIVEPSTELEQCILDMCREIISKDDFGVTTNLFNIGFTSLTVIQLLARISDELKVDVSMMDMMKSKNIVEIAKIVDNCDEDEEGIESENYELTPNQLGVYFECIRDPESTSYNLPKKISFNKNIDAMKLRDSIIKSIDLHPFLKNRIVIDGAKVLNHKYESGIDEIEIEQINEVTSDVISEFVKPFDIIDNQLFRFKIYVTPSNTVLLADFHHLIVDGTSLNILFNDITAIYDEDEDRISNAGADTYEYISKENNYKLSEKNGKSEKFFDDMLCDFDENTVLTTNLTGDEENANLAVFKSRIEKNMVDEFCSHQKISPNILFMSSAVLTLSKYVSNKDILISTLFNGRDNPKYQNLIGMLVKTIPIAFKTDRDMDIKKYFEFVNNIWMNVLNHSSYNYVEIANKYELDTDFLYAFHGKIIEDVSINGEKYPRESIDHDLLSCKISLNVLEVDDDYEIIIDYNDELYTEDYISTFINSIITVIKEFMANKLHITAEQLYKYWYREVKEND